METTTLETLRLGVAEYLGLTSLPMGNTKSYDLSIQDGINYCWRYHPWNFSIKRDVPVDVVTVGENTRTYMPVDFDILGWRDLGTDEVSIRNSKRKGVYLQYDDGRSQFEIIGDAPVTVSYQTTPPRLTQVIAFPSIGAITLAASIFQKKKDMPTSSNESQNWDLLHTMLDQLAGNEFKNTPLHKPKNRYENVDLYNTEG